MKNPQKRNNIAIALSYEEGLMHAPAVSAVGREKIAKAIIKTAKRYGIPVVKDKNLINKLSELEENELVPTELYYDIARLLNSIDKKGRTS